MKNFLINYFPPPDYLAMPAIGFDISDLSIKYVEFSKRGDRLIINRFGERLMPQGMIEAGDIKDKERLINFLSPLKKELKSKYITSCLPEEKAFLARLDMPVMDREDLRKAIELELEEHIPLSLGEAVFDFDVKREDGEDHLDVFVIAFPKSVVNDYTEVFTRAGFLPLIFEMEIQAAARAVVSRDEKKTFILVDFGRTRSSMAIVRGEEVFFSSTIRVAGQDIDKMLMKNLDIDQFQAEKIKREQGMARENEKIFNSILPIVSVIKDEISRAIFFWNSRVKDDDDKKISKVLLCGGDSNLLGFPEYVSYELKLPVEIGNPWVNVLSFDEQIPEIELRDALKYSTAIGLALRKLKYV